MSRCKRKERRRLRKRAEEEGEKEEKEDDEVREEKKKEKADVLEPEKCPLPREVGPFFPLLTGGENIYKTNRVHITSESTDTAHSKTHLYRNVNAATREKLHSKTPIQHLAESCQPLISLWSY